MNTKPAYLVLADGTVFQGTSFGAYREAIGELVFTTGMTGYQETLTDPSFTGQLICQTFPAIGNYGTNAADAESPRIWAAAYIVREWCQRPSNFRSEGNIHDYLVNHGIPGLCGIDTRALTRRLRRYGTINAALLPALPSNMPALLQTLRTAQPLKDAVYTVSPTTIHTQTPPGGARHRVVMLNYGAKAAITRQLLSRGCEVISVPAATSAKVIANLSPDGILLSNGPGNPADYTPLVATVKELFTLGKPIMGICIGHQLLALAMGAKTYRLPFGHRGANQPVTHIATGKTYITSQNHGFAVVDGSLPRGVGHTSYQNANDASIEGIEYPSINAFSVQFHPEACAGPEDTAHLFTQFVASLV